MFEEGEVMTCLICGRQAPFPGPEAPGWRALTVGDEQPYYLCPLELPGDGYAADDFAIAYQIVILALFIVRQGGLLLSSPLGPWVAARRSGRVPRYSYDAFLEFLPNLIGSSLN
jgi:hypothetical protein